MKHEDQPFAVRFARHAAAVVDVIKDGGNRGLQGLAVIAISASSALSVATTDSGAHCFEPLAPSIMLIRLRLSAPGDV